jgi:hypothetical protein
VGRRWILASSDCPHSLHVFYDYRRGATARFAFKRSLVVMRKIRLDSSEQHRHAALSATRVFYFLLRIGGYRRDPRWFHWTPPIGFAGGSATGLSVTDACGHTAADDAPNLGARDAVRQQTLE